MSDKDVLAVNSATAGLHLAVEALGIGPGDEVILPTWTFTATAEVVEYVGADVVLCDVDSRTLNVSADKIEACITERTRAIMVVHFAGLSADMADIHALAKRYKLLVIEDAAHAFPAKHIDGRPVGDCGQSDAVVFSFYANKTMTTGEGGMLVVKDAEIARRARIMRLHGIDRDVFDRYRSSRPSWKYDVVSAGFKYNLTDMAAACGRVQLERAQSMRDRRGAIAQRYSREIKSDYVSGLQLKDEEVEGSAWHLFPVVVNSGRRDEFISHLSSLGIGASVHFIPLHSMSHWRRSSSAFPSANARAAEIASIPLYSTMTDHEVTRVIEAVNAFA